MPDRLQQLGQWLEQACGLSSFALETASADASFRRYFRVTLADGETRIAMDAPPDREDCRPFLAVGKRLEAVGLHVPHVFAADPDLGFVLLEDLGSESYLAALEADPATAGRLYDDAIDALVRMQAEVDPVGLPAYDEALLLRELQLFPDWLLACHLGIELDAAERRMYDGVCRHLVENALAQPTVCVHRDYHSRNLMRVARRNPGVIDFQDAVAGPASYDLVSLLRDCYIAWPSAQVAGWVDRYFEQAHAAGVLDSVDRNRFDAWFDLMGVQRHLKAAGIFARLYHRDGKAGYLGDVPRTLQYIVDVAELYSTLQDLGDLITQRLLPRLRF